MLYLRKRFHRTLYSDFKRYILSVLVTQILIRKSSPHRSSTYHKVTAKKKQIPRGYLCFSSFTMYREGCREPSIRRRATYAMQTPAWFEREKKKLRRVKEEDVLRSCHDIYISDKRGAGQRGFVKLREVLLLLATRSNVRERQTQFAPVGNAAVSFDKT